MNRLLTILATAALVVGVLAGPAQAQEPPAPETAPSPESLPVGADITCTVQRGHPFMEIFGGGSWLSSYYSANCQPSPAWRILTVSLSIRYGVSGDGSTWAQYSNQATVKNRVGPGVVQWSPHRNDCDTGGLWRFYRQRVDITVVYQRISTGVQRTASGLTAIANQNRLPCGTNEPG